VALSTVLSVIASVVGVVLWCTGRMWSAFVLNLLWALVFIGATTRLISEGALGLSLAYLTAYLLHLILVSIYVRSLLDKAPAAKTVEPANSAASAWTRFLN
jgi:hypothetical protein